MFKEIKQLLEEKGKRSLRDLSAHFSMAPDALEPMLDLLIRKGQVQRHEAGCGTSCSGCASACREDMLLYEIIDLPD